MLRNLILDYEFLSNIILGVDQTCFQIYFSGA